MIASCNRLVAGKNKGEYTVIKPHIKMRSRFGGIVTSNTKMIMTCRLTKPKQENLKYILNHRGSPGDVL